MKNTMDFTNKSTQAAAATAMKKLIAEKGEERTMNEMFEIVNQQTNMSRKEFEEVFREGTEQLASWESDECTSRELKAEELDMVAGGGVWDWICENKRAIIIGACALALGAAGAALGATAYMSVIGLSAVGSGAVGGFLGAVLGGGVGFVFTMDKNEAKNCNSTPSSPLLI